MADAAGRAGDEPSALQSVDRALAVVELLLRHREALPARAIAEQVGINRATAHRLLNALMHRGWIDKPAGTAAYRLSLRFLALAQVSGGMRSVLDGIQPIMERLSQLSRETVHVAVLDGYEVLHVDRLDSLERVGVASKVGSRAAAHTTGLGKALLAALDDDAVAGYAETCLGGNSPAADRFWTEIRTTRARGYSIDDEEDAIGVRCLGVAILGAGDTPMFALSLTGPSPRFTMERVRELAPTLVAEAQAVSRQFGWDGPAAPDRHRRRADERSAPR